MSVINFPFYGNAIYGAAINLPTGVPDGTLAVTLDTYTIWLYKAATATWMDAGDPLTPILAPDGTAALPAYSFLTDPDTGMYLSAANTIGLSAGGVLRASLSTTALTSTVQILNAAGSAGAPAYSFASDPNTGMWSGGPDSIVFNLGGATGIDLQTTGCFFTPPISVPNGSAAAPSYTFNNALAAGLYRTGASAFGLSGAGVQQAEVSGAGVEFKTFAYLADGAVATPSLRFTNDQNTGLYSVAADNVGVAAGGVLALSILSTGVSVPGTFEVTGLSNLSAAGVRTKVSTANVTAPPTNAEMVSAFGAAATVGSGFIALVDDNAGHADEFIVWSDGTKYWYATGTACA